jgi:hypothetical protein
MDSDLFVIYHESWSTRFLGEMLGEIKPFGPFVGEGTGSKK